MKQKRTHCPLTPPGRVEPCPLTPATRKDGKPGEVLVIRTGRRSWFTLAITGFGAVLLRYLKTVREKAKG